MIVRLTRFARRILVAVAYSVGGAVVTLVIVGVVYLEARPELDVWHLADLDEEFTEASGVDSFSDYLALEDRLFAQLHAQVYAKVPASRKRSINRYDGNSLSDPESWSPNWNRSFELTAATPKAGVLLLHGMSDSPYSLRALGEALNAAGATVVGMRLPGHGTAPSGLVEVTWQDMAAAVRLAMRHLATQVAERPLYIVGYSTGAALAVNYALATLDDGALPKVARMILLSPAIGVSSAAAFAVWQGRLGHLLGLEKLAWTSILPEYDPYKYGSFAVNAGDVVYRLTLHIQNRLDDLGGRGKLAAFPPVLAFSSVVDATVSTPALVRNLFDRLPQGGHELVLFDINRMAEMEPIMTSDPSRCRAGSAGQSAAALRAGRGDQRERQEPPAGGAQRGPRRCDTHRDAARPCLAAGSSTRWHTLRCRLLPTIPSTAGRLCAPGAASILASSRCAASAVCCRSRRRTCCACAGTLSFPTWKRARWRSPDLAGNSGE
jgi:alpha-beta hydrolase superfamily lysophospholipase